ncbi:MAG: ABC transporter permease subunit, partial [Paracoccaceae bacterium]
MTRSILPILTVVLALLLIWYAAAVAMNAAWTRDVAARKGTELTTSALVKDTMTQKRPKLPAPHQVAAELWDSTVMKAVTSKRSLVFHGWVTLSATLAGFVIGTLAGILLAVGIVHNRAMDMSVMPWAIASQTIPILAIAPMIIVVLNTVGIQGLIPKAIISAYLSFFPVVVGMVAGLRSPDMMQLDLLKTYNASTGETFWKLRLPSSMPYLFTSLKVWVAASLVGAI